MTIHPITLRPSTPADREALALRAALDSAPPPPGDALVAEQDGDLLAAVSVDGDAAIADPFKPTAAVVSLLRAWSHDLRPAAA